MTAAPSELEELAVRVEAARFRLKRWDVTVPGYGTGTYCRPTRGKALADAWRSDVFNNVSFGEFIRVARCRRAPVDPPQFGTPITVLGKPAFFIGRDSQYVTFVYPGGDFPLVAHPLDVLPEESRPPAYRARAANPPRRGIDMTKVVQADRDAAADWLAIVRLTGWEPMADDMRAGQMDENPLVQAFARHREAALEEAAKIALEQRCERDTPWDLACTTIAAAIRAGGQS